MQDSQNYSLIGHSAADTVDKVDPNILERDSEVLALLAVWIANNPEPIGHRFSPDKIAESLQGQRKTLELLRLWPK